MKRDAVLHTAQDIILQGGYKMIRSFTVKTRHRSELRDITQEVQHTVSRSGIREGVCYIFNPHTTAGLTVNEGADPSVAEDILALLERLVPRNGSYRHSEGNSDAHVKASLMGSTATLQIEGGKLLLGTWQSVFFCEFDGPRTRKVRVHIISSER